MTRRQIGSTLAGIASAGYLATAALHATGYGPVTRLAAQAPAELQAVAPALWLAFSIDLTVVGLIVAVVAVWPGRASRRILIIASLCPIGAAALQVRFLGFIPPTAILLGIGGLALIAATVLPPVARRSTP